MSTFAARMKRLRRPLPKPRKPRKASGRWALFYDDTDHFVEALDLAEECYPAATGNPMALCGGCTACLMMQSSRADLRIERIDSEHPPKPCSTCYGRGRLVGFTDLLRHKCLECDGLGAVL